MTDAELDGMVNRAAGVATMYRHLRGTYDDVLALVAEVKRLRDELDLASDPLAGLTFADLTAPCEVLPFNPPVTFLRDTRPEPK